MCLTTPKLRRQVFKQKKENGFVVAWKVFRYDRNLKFQFMSTYQTLEIRKWLNEKNFRESSDLYLIGFGFSKYSHYKTGFHCYLTYKDALNNCEHKHDQIVKKVYVKRIVQRGWQDACKVLVAKDMFICRRCKCV